MCAWMSRVLIPRAYMAMIFSSKAGEAPLVLADQHRVEPAPAVPGNVQHDPLAARVDRLARRAVAVVAGFALARIGQMDVHLRAQHALGQGLLQFPGQGLEVQCPAGTTFGNQFIQQLTRDAVVVLLCHTFLLSNSSWYGSGHTKIFTGSRSDQAFRNPGERRVIWLGQCRGGVSLQLHTATRYSRSRQKLVLPKSRRRRPMRPQSTPRCG